MRSTRYVRNIVVISPLLCMLYWQLYFVAAHLCVASGDIGSHCSHCLVRIYVASSDNRSLRLYSLSCLAYLGKQLSSFWCVCMSLVATPAHSVLTGFHFSPWQLYCFRDTGAPLVATLASSVPTSSGTLCFTDRKSVV